MKRYIRVWLKARGARPITLQLLSTDGGYIKGIEVDENGDEIKPNGADERMHLIPKSMVKSVHRMTWNPVYAQLVYSGDRHRGVPWDLLPSFV